MREVFLRLRKANLKLKAKKCLLFQKKILYLGHIVSEDGVSTDPSKIKAVKEWPTPTSVTEVRSFLGLCAYYRRFIRDFSKIAASLHKLTEKGKKFSWSSECDQAFATLKECLITAPILSYPDPKKRFILDTDASDVAIGAVLSQEQGDGERVIAYGSKCLSKAERRYCVTRRELLALVYFVKHFRYYLYGARFLLRTDHGSLRWLFNFKSPEGQIARWLETLATFDLEIKHRPGKQHGNADGLSRIPCKQCGREEETEVGVINAINDTTEFPENFSWNAEQIRVNQEEDPLIGRVLTLKQQHTSKPAWRDISAENEDLKTYWYLWDQLNIKNGILYKLWVEQTSGTKIWQVVTPKKMTEEVMKELHDHVTAGHLGQHKTLARVRQRFYWLNLKEDVIRWCNQCDLCATRKDPNPRRRATLKQYQVGCTMERVAMDIIGPLPVSRRGNKYILVLADYFTKWTEAFPMRNQEAVTVAKRFVNDFICRFGVPLQVHTDQGRQFESALFTEVCSLLDIDKTRTTSFHPMSDGLVERFNRTLENMLSLFVAEHQKDWDEYIPMLMMAYRSTTQESTYVSPYKMMFGREVNLPIDLMMGLPDPEAPTLLGVDYVEDLQTKMLRCHEFARSHLRKSAERQKRNYDVKVNGSVFKTGEYVWLFTPKRQIGRTPKLQRYWDGPYRIIEKISDALYKIQKSARTKEKVIHFNRLKPYTGKLAPHLEPEEEEVTTLEDDISTTEPHRPIDDSDSDSEEDVAEPAVSFSTSATTETLERPTEVKEPTLPPVNDNHLRRSSRMSKAPKRLIEEI